jgi:lysophospholipase L1-like esterase
MSNLVFIGDSLTEWYDWQERFPEHRARNLGISGETVEELLDRRERIHEIVRAPDVVFLMTGINNIANGQYDIFGPYREIVRNLTTWYKGATIVVQSVLPVDFPWVGPGVIRDVNRNMEKIAEEFNAKYLDVYSSFVTKDDKPKDGLLSDDGVHLSAKGYEVWAKAVEEFLDKRLKQNVLQGKTYYRP